MAALFRGPRATRETMFRPGDRLARRLPAPAFTRFGPAVTKGWPGGVAEAVMVSSPSVPMMNAMWRRFRGR
jgi:hypothetical protein